jgi:hypothetical protein
MAVEHAPRVTVWANGFGIWHVRVPRDCVSPLIAALRTVGVDVPRPCARAGRAR